jgi:GTP-binding protein EngB required for normal cell division
MSLFSGSLRYIAITAKRRQNYCSSQQLVLQLSASSVSSVSSSIATPFLSSSSSLSSLLLSAKHFSSSSLNDYNSEDDNSGSDSGIISVRSQFKDIPVDPSIIQYIKRVGVGRSVRRDNIRRKKRPFENKKKYIYTDNNNNNDNTLSRDEEQYYLEGQEVKHRRRQSSQSQSQSHLPSNNLPPPFGDPRCETITRQRQRQRRGSSNVKANSTTSDDDDDDTMTISRSIQVLPVKLLGRMTTTPSKNDNNENNNDDDYDTKNVFPRPTSGLPEVAIVGRSNVGKSTLLNALLYGGRTMKKDNDEEGEGEQTDNNNNNNNNNSMKRRNRRRRTSQTSKLPRGVKAKTSSKPGETRSIDFYQLSVQITDVEKSSDDDDNDYHDKNENDNRKNSVNARSKKKKMSLLLVDFPGYGFARGPKKERNKSVDINGFDNDDESSSSDEMKFLFPWQSLIETYITDRPRSSLKRVLLLIDARHGMKQADVNILVSLQNALMLRQKQHRNNQLDGDNNNNSPTTSSSSTTRLPPKVPTELPPLQIVLTKCDLVSQSDLARRVIQVRQQLSDCLIRQPKILPEMLVSAQMEGHLGVLELQKELASLCGDGWR